MDQEWVLREKGFDADTNRAIEGLFTQGSGYLHLRGSLEEHLSDAPQDEEYLRMPANVTAEKFRSNKAKWGTYVPGVYGKHPLLNNEIINLPSFVSLVPYVDGERLDLERCEVASHERALDLRTGVLRRSLVWKTGSGKRIEVRFERFISASRRSLTMARMTVASDQPASLEVHAGIDGAVRTNGYDHFATLEPWAGEEKAIGIDLATDAGDRVRMRSQLFSAPGEVRVALGGRGVWLVCSAPMEPGVSLSLEKRTAVETSRDRVRKPVEEALEEAQPRTFDELLAEHEEVWARRWRNSDVVLDGDPESQRAMRVSIYHLLRAHVGGDERVAIDAKGYAGEAYWGRFFWDTEMYLLPFYAATDPERAATLVGFRIQSLDGARQNAARYGYSGARYAWESDPAGLECCPNWQYADHEVHVSADVVYGLSYFEKSVGDEEFLESKAADVVLETARYWMERIDSHPSTGRPSLLGVMGPDEYKPITNNNLFTNMMVADALERAAEVGTRRGDPAAELFGKAAQGLPLPRRNDGLYLQCDGFEEFADPQFDRLWKDRGQPFAAQVS
ncbi:MAG TPA: hypothetical protein VGE01_15190, partial [Fimbriimonas sp.]